MPRRYCAKNGPTGNAGSRRLAVEVLTAIGERDGAVWDAERRAGEALRTMTDDEGLSVRAAAEWCGNGVTMREVTRLRRLAPDTPGDAD